MVTSQARPDTATAAPSDGSSLFPNSGSWGHRPALDGTRAIAVYLVVAFHAGVATFEGGFVGVDVFFVLSGYLMTNVLLTEIDSTNRLRLARFYARRARRLLPASIAVILGTSALLSLVMPVAERFRLVDDARFALVYLANWNYISSATDYFASEDAASPFLHFWSLSLEEQYYFFFPILLLVFVALARRLRSNLVVPISLGIIALLSLAAQIYWQSRDPLRAYYGTDARLYQILFGAILAAAFLISRPGARFARYSGGISAATLAGLVLLSTNLVGLNPSMRGIFAAALTTTFVASLEIGDGSRVSRLLKRPTMTYLGAVSYGTYLWHWPVIVFLKRLLDLNPWTMFVLATAIATGLAALSYQVLETPIRRNAFLDRHAKTVALGGLAASVLVAAAVVPSILRWDTRPTLAQGSPLIIGADDLGQELVPSGIDYRALAGDRPPFPTCDSSNPAECTIVSGDGLHVLLVGDSHARMLIPSLEAAGERDDLTVSVNVTPSCPWQLGLINTLRPVSEQAICEQSREGWYQETLPQLDPDIVVLVSLARDGDGATPGQMVPIDPALNGLPMGQLIDELSVRTFDLLSAPGRSVVVIEPVPRAEFNVLDCLSGAELVADCAFDGTDSIPPSEDTYRRLAATEVNVSTIDIDPLLCPDLPVCLPIVNDIVVRRDGSHITSAFATFIGPDLWDLVLGRAAAVTSN